MSTTSRRISVVTGTAVLVTAVFVAATAAAGPPALAGPAVAATAAGAAPTYQPAAETTYVPITPCRILDTRVGTGVDGTPLTSSETRTYRVGGAAGFPAQGGRAAGCGIPVGAGSVAGTITAIDPVGGGFVRAWPPHCLSRPRPNLNYRGAPISTGVTLSIDPSTAEALAVKNYGGTTGLVIDISGYYVAPLAGTISPTGTAYAGSSRISAAARTGVGSYQVTFDRRHQVLRGHRHRLRLGSLCLRGHLRDAGPRHRCRAAVRFRRRSGGPVLLPARRLLTGSGGSAGPGNLPIGALSGYHLGMASRQRKNQPRTERAIPQRYTEIETKLEIADGTMLPRLTGQKTLAAVGLVGAAPVVVHDLDAVYYDTEHLDLLRSKLTLRRRTGGDDAGWHLKLPGSGRGRTEVRLPLAASTEAVPVELADLVRGAARGRPLVPVARLENRRTVRTLLDRDDQPLIEVADDAVTATPLRPAGGDRQQWRELEVEIVGGTAEQLAATVALLRSGGAEPASTASKVGRALPLPAIRPDLPWAANPPVRPSSAA